MTRNWRVRWRLAGARPCPPHGWLAWSHCPLGHCLVGMAAAACRLPGRRPPRPPWR